MESEAALSREFAVRAQNPAARNRARFRRRLWAARAIPQSAEKVRLAAYLKARRNQLGLTQQSLSQKLGVRASHIALLENARRRPSLALIGRLAAALGVNGREILDLAYPEIRSLLSATSTPRTKPNRSWQRLLNDTGLLARYRVTPQELDVLERLSLLGGKITAKRLLAILLLARDIP
ncbi:MAG: helix-turn-helix transcriptional regulator [Deltaproteobacteria bacterium]|nr:helix-turn-helix transcriptional regulator [Deltaproteobacteria bacterium]